MPTRSGKDYHLPQEEKKEKTGKKQTDKKQPGKGKEEGVEAPTGSGGGGGATKKQTNPKPKPKPKPAAPGTSLFVCLSTTLNDLSDHRTS